MSVLIETTVGDLVVDLFLKERPNACKNFLKLCKVKYYNLCQFFTIEPNYIAQTGDPSNSGRGGESIHGILFGDQARYFEMEQVPKIRHSHRGLISMVNNGAGLIGSQFFITLADNLDFLDGKHCIFGQVAEGFDTVTKLNEQIVDDNNRPYRDVRIAHTIVLDDPFDDPPRLQIPRRSPSPTLDLIKLENQMALDERVDEDEGKSADEVKKELEQKDMRAQAEILTMVGDLHHVEERPPDNVLFVCKLNPVTTDEDLEVIFSRFGTIVKCEVIKDRRTAASLQYAFVEFEQPEQCEQAFLKMDNVLIDDRRIHVDFSQSVSKNFQWNPKTDKDAKPAPNADKGADRANKVSHKEQQRRPARRSSPPAAAKSSTPRQHSSPRHGSTSSSRHRHRNGEGGGGGAEERRDDRRPQREDDRRRRDSSRERRRNDDNEKRRQSSREREEQRRRHREEEEGERRGGDRGGARGRDHRGGGGDDDRRRHSRR